MVFAVQCPNPKCKKYMLVEDHQKGKVVPCLLCKTNIKIGTGTSVVGTKKTPMPKSN
jgi:hypothetical protein